MPGSAGGAAFQTADEQESGQRLRQLAGVSRHVFWMRDAATDELLYLSPAFSMMFGRPLHEAAARPASWSELLHPADCGLAAALRAQARRGEPATGQYRILRADGVTRRVEEEIVPINEAGRLVRLTGTITDITDRHDADQQLRVFRSLIETATDVFYVVRPADDFRLIFVNEAGERHFGRPIAELLKMHMWDLDREFTAEACQVFWTQLKQQRVASFESNHRRADGTVVRVEVSTSYVRHGDDELIAGNFRDVSSRVRGAPAGTGDAAR
jgi:PAS domain S-box-containing protein